MEVKQKKLPNSQIELEFELTADEFKEHTLHAVEHLKHHVKIDGFREGKAPSAMVEEKLKPEALLMEAGDHAVQHVYTEYILENKLEPVGQPEVSIVKIAKGSEFIFKAVITVLPNVELPNYKEIAKTVKGKDITITEEEVQDAINYLQKTRAKFTLKNDVAENKDFVEVEYSSKDIDNEGMTKIKNDFVVGKFFYAELLKLKIKIDTIATVKNGDYDFSQSFKSSDFRFMYIPGDESYYYRESIYNEETHEYLQNSGWVDTRDEGKFYVFTQIP